jgi:hypothetical protein
MLERPSFVQGVFAATGKGLDRPSPLTPRAVYRVPADKRAQTIYFRAGNAAPELISLVLTRRGDPMRYFPVGARQALHVALAVLEDISPDTEIEVLAAAPDGLTATVVLDIGFMEVA